MNTIHKKENTSNTDETNIFSTSSLQIGMKYELLNNKEAIYIGFQDFVEWASINNGFFTTIYQENISPLHIFYNESENLFEAVKIGTITQELGLITPKKTESLQKLYRANKLARKYTSYSEVEEDKRPKHLVDNSSILAPVLRSLVKRISNEWFFIVYKNVSDSRINYALMSINKDHDTHHISFDIVYPEHWEIYKDIIDFKRIKEIENKVSKLAQREAGFFNKFMQLFDESKKGALPRQLKNIGFKYLKIH